MLISAVSPVLNKVQNAHSTEHAILQLVNQITDAFNPGKYTLEVFIGLSKAFDKVNHNTLLEKLKAYGIQFENWNGLEAICQIGNGLFRTKIPKQKWKLLNVVFPKVL